MNSDNNLNIEALRQAEKSLHNRNQGLAALLEVSTSLAASLDMQTILQTAVDEVANLVGLNTAAVYLLDGQHLHLWATTPPLPPQFPHELRISPVTDHPHLQQSMTTGQQIHIHDFRKAELSPAEQAVVEQRNLRTALFIPLIADGEVMGAFIVGSTEEPASVSNAVIDLANTLANLAALAVKNAQLFQDGQTYATQLEQALADRIRAEAEKQRLETQLLQAQKLESIGRLAGGIAHDFNNMLSVILGRTDLALTKVNSDDSLHRDLTQIRNAAQRSANLTRQLLAFARKQTIEPKLINFNNVIGDMLTMLRRLIGEDIDLSWLPANNLGLVKIDPSQIDQILANLCINARDAISGTGKITIETVNASFDEVYCATHAGFLPGDYVMLAVGDNGCGMSDEVLLNIFEPFYSTKKVGEGTGLGLSTVYGIVKQNNGFINVYSEPGQGTIFKIYLPRHYVEGEVSVGETAVSLPQHGCETILLVEDEPMVLNLAQQMLESLGYHILTANSPAEALELAAAYEAGIDLLITDVVMPEMNGPELAEQLSTLFPGIKILYMSGYTANVIVHHGVLHEGIKLLPKPFSKESLAAKVREAISVDAP